MLRLGAVAAFVAVVGAEVVEEMILGLVKFLLQWRLLSCCWGSCHWCWGRGFRCGGAA